jgi:hypothetical protein
MTNELAHGMARSIPLMSIHFVSAQAQIQPGNAAACLSHEASNKAYGRALRF